MNDFAYIIPEILLGVTLAGIVASEIAYHGERVRMITATALFGLGGAFLQTLLTYRFGPAQIFGGNLSVDGLSLCFKLFFIVLAALVVLTSAHSREFSSKAPAVAGGKRAEFCALIIASALAMCITAASQDLLLGFLSLQFVNLLAHFLAAFSKNSSRSIEAAIKHLVFAAVAAFLMLYGMALLFGATHTLNIAVMHQQLVAHPLPRETGLVVFVLIFSSLSFQFCAFPMHLWAPDVIEGAPTPVSAFLALGPRVAGFSLALRYLLVLFSQPTLSQGQWQPMTGWDWTQIVATVSGASMVIGSLLAFRQTAAKRMVAYLLVAQSGFLLLGILVLDEIGVAALLYNLWVDLFALIGVFYVISFLYDHVQSDRLEDLKGMLQRAVPEGIALILFLACLVGLPPLPGFLGKFTLIGSAIQHQWYFLSCLAIFAMAVSTLAVARLAFSLVGSFEAAEPIQTDYDTSRRTLLGALFVPLLLAGVFAEIVLQWAGQSLRFILW